MATTTTIKVAEAISLLSEALSIEIAATQQFLEDDETAEETISYEDYEEFKSLVNEFTTENYDGLEEVQNDLQIAVGTVGDSTLRWPYDEEDEDEEDEEDDTPDDFAAGDAPASVADSSEPTDEEKIESLMQAGTELQDQIEEHEHTIEDLKTIVRNALDTISGLVTAAETFKDQIEEY